MVQVLHFGTVFSIKVLSLGAELYCVTPPLRKGYSSAFCSCAISVQISGAHDQKFVSVLPVYYRAVTTPRPRPRIALLNL